MDKIYVCIDLKSFYASVECVLRKLDPLNTNLVVADSSRTDKTVCLAITPSLKQYGLGGRSRLYLVKQTINNVNKNRLKENNYKKFSGKSYLDDVLKNNKNFELDYIIAPPQMKKYMKYSTDIYKIYLKYISPDDIFVYSIDEVFCDITNYLKTYNLTPKELVSNMIQDVYKKTGITATAGIGTNMYLAKVAMDIVAKHTEPNKIGVRIAELNELSYRKLLWDHTPLTDFWRIGKGISKKLESNGIYTMGDIAITSLEDENKLFKLFGVNAEFIIDHAWGYEPTTIKEAKSYIPQVTSISKGQVLHEACNYEKTRLIIKEMSDLISLELNEKNSVTNQIVLTIYYDISNIENEDIRNKYVSEVTLDMYGRTIPKHSHGTINLKYYTSSSKIITKNTLILFDKIINKNLFVRKINISVCNLKDEEEINKEVVYEQLNLFNNNYNEIKKEKDNAKDDIILQKTILNIKNKYGKNSILKGINYLEGATTMDRNNEVGGHRG